MFDGTSPLSFKEISLGSQAVTRKSNGDDKHKLQLSHLIGNRYHIAPLARPESRSFAVNSRRGL